MNQDRKLIAVKTQDYEVDYICSKYNIPKDVVIAAIEQVGISRRKVYKVLRELGYMKAKATLNKRFKYGDMVAGGGTTTSDRIR